MYLGMTKRVLGLKEKDPLQAGKIMRELLDEPCGLDLHVGMFIPTIQGQGDAEQQKAWLPLAFSLQIIGTYAQTELGHGTYIRGLETTATYDPSSEEFIIHSPTLTSTKWWPGGLGKTANHVICMAKLIIGGEDKGPHAFVVRIRDARTHAPLAGIIVGDIGTKLGYNAIDNGFLRFDHFRIPRRAMLMKHAKVDADGSYHPPPVAKAAYGTMVFVRADIVQNAALFLKKALTIAVRYSAVRRQSNADPRTGRELQVLDYAHTQRTLLPLIATAYAFHFTALNMRDMYVAFERESRKSGDFSALPELHATSSGLKALCSWVTKDGIETCRLACGGHGYMDLAGFGTSLGNYMPNVTYEGDNNVLCLQTARYLLKAAGVAAAGATPAGGAFYLQRQGKPTRSPLGISAEWRDADALLDAFYHRSSRLTGEAAMAAAASHAADRDTFAADQLAWIRAAKAHCAAVVLRSFIEGVGKSAPGLPPSCGAMLRRQVALYALSCIDDSLGDFLEDGYFDAKQAQGCRLTLRSLLGELRPDAVAAVDAFGLSDYFLHSALGCEDGDVYKRLFDQVQGLPLNVSATGPGYERLLQPRLSKGFGKPKL
jgi:acyl-CoA oxidase